VWKPEARERDLDSNVIALPAGGGIDSHTGPETETGTIDLSPGAILWLPRRSRRQFAAGADGLRYLTVHQRRQALLLEPLTRKAV
jgi:hypothetical protein